MAVIKTLTITFSEVNNVEIDDSILIQISNGATTFFLSEIFKSLRTSYGKVTVATSGTLSEVNAFNLSQAINLDSGLTTIQSSVLDNVVTLTLSEDSYYFITPTGSLIDDSKVTIGFTTQDPIVASNIEIDSYTIKYPDTCLDVNAVLNVVGGSNTYNVYVNNVLTLSSQTTPISVPVLRGKVDLIRVVDDLGVTIGTITSNNPRKVISSDITTSVLNLDTGANLTISVAYISPYVSPYEYSLDNVTFQSENIFTGLVDGNYTVYVRDAFECVSSANIVIDGYTELTETVFSISDINALRFALYDENAKKNFKNTLSCNELRLTPYSYVQQFIESDIITTQFKTNASYIKAYTIDSDLNANELSVVKRTENIGLTAKSTCTYFDLGDDRSGVYFGVVDLLNPLNDDVIGDADYGFTLPEWANTEGNYVTIDGLGQVVIDKVGYSETYQSFILEFDIVYNGDAVEKYISASYNLQPYEIYEFNTVMSSEPLNFNVVIECGKAEDDVDFTYVSEKIKRVEDSPFLFEIDYYSEDKKNVGGMVYQTGIKHKLRLNGHVTDLGEQTTEGYDGDEEFYVTDNKVYSSEKFSFFRLSSAMAKKLRLVFPHSYLTINGIRYKLAEAPELSESTFSNLKNFFVTLKSGGNLFIEGSDEQITGTSASLEIGAGIVGIKGKSLLLWTKING